MRRRLKTRAHRARGGAPSFYDLAVDLIGSVRGDGLPADFGAPKSITCGNGAAAKRVIVDSALLVGVIRGDDQHHAWAVARSLCMTELQRCPNCGSRRIERLARPFRARVAGKWVRIPNLEREICPDCHEEYFDRDANIIIDEACFGKQRRRA